MPPARPPASQPPPLPLAVFNFSKQGESTESPGTGGWFTAADRVSLYKILCTAKRRNQIKKTTTKEEAEDEIKMFKRLLN